MTKAERIAYSEKHVRRAKLFERQFLRPVFDALYSIAQSFTRDMKAHGIDHAKRNLDKTLFNEKLDKVLQDLYVTVGLYQANKSSHEINQSVKGNEIKAGFGFNEEWTKDILEFLKEHVLDKVVLSTSDPSREMIEKILLQGQQEGWSVDQMASQILASDVPLWRAKLIVRTELSMARFIGNELAKRDSKFETEDTWIAAHDHKTRHSHRIVDGDTIGEGGRFKVPIYKRVDKVDIQIGFDVMKGPGDPNASAGNICNCRCTKVTRARRDDNGRLIRKRQTLETI